jgi:hypothetical protein
MGDTVGTEHAGFCVQQAGRVLCVVGCVGFSRPVGFSVQLVEQGSAGRQGGSVGCVQWLSAALLQAGSSTAWFQCRGTGECGVKAHSVESCQWTCSV